MANTDVTLSEQVPGVWGADINEISVSAGDTFTISATGDQVVIYFSPALISILSPQPLDQMPIDGGQNISFTFQSSASGAYSIAYSPDGAAEVAFPSDESQVVALILALPIPPPPPPPPPPNITGPNTSPEGNQ